MGFQKRIRSGEVQKEYVCRVEGQFPEGEVLCDQPIDVSSLKLGISVISSSGKPSCTIFKRISTSGRTSLVHCQPLTGRTHQIRVHLQYLGFPIVNDPLYGHPFFGPLLGKGGLTEPQRMQMAENFQRARPKANETLINPTLFDSSSSLEPLSLPIEFDGSLLPHQQVLCLWLHAARYSGPGFDFSAPLPDWAQDGFDDSLSYQLRATEATLPWALDDVMEPQAATSL